MDDHIKLPLLASLCSSGPFTFLLMKLQMSTTKQMAIYTTFNNQGIIKENYVEIIPISKLVGTELNAPNIMKALIKFFAEINVPIA